ncbi:DUF411 domain-containing protein [Pseudophaeobacter sp.]|uniref:DUF411 domain-containing protein n=1 Tax=Pseudophaeobacter sp. TaxID=1971739 RepID=UPI003299DCB0
MHRRTLLFTAAALPLASLPALAGPVEPLLVMKSPTCGCCTAWVDHLKLAGFATDTRTVEDDQLWSMKSRLGITAELSSCHTALAGAYVVEGHVPVGDIQRLLTERPDALGLTVPGMPIGSPGMEMGGEKEPFETLLIKPDGSTVVFAQHS